MTIVKKYMIFSIIAALFPFIMFGILALIYLRSCYPFGFWAVLLVIAGVGAGVRRYKRTRPLRIKTATLALPAPKAPVKKEESLAFAIAQTKAKIKRDMETLYPGVPYTLRKKNFAEQFLLGKIELIVGEKNVDAIIKDGVYERLVVKRPRKAGTSKPKNASPKDMSSQNEPIVTDEPFASEDSMAIEPPKFDYDRLAATFLQDNLKMLEKKCQNAIAKGKSEYVVPPDELPEEPETWYAICQQLKTERYGYPDASVFDGGGIIVTVPMPGSQQEEFEKLLPTAL